MKSLPPQYASAAVGGDAEVDEEAAVPGLVLPFDLAGDTVEREDEVVVRRHVEGAVDRERIRLLSPPDVRIDAAKVDGEDPAHAVDVVPADLRQRRMPVVVGRPAEAGPVACGVRSRDRATAGAEREGDEERRSGCVPHASTMVLTRRFSTCGSPNTRTSTSTQPGERDVRSEQDRRPPAAGRRRDRAVAHRGGQQLAGVPEVSLTCDRPELGRVRGRRIVGAVLGLRLAVAIDALRGVPELDDDELAARGRRCERRALAVGEDHADPPLDLRGEEAPGAESGEGVEARGDPGDLLRRRRLDRGGLLQRRREHVLIERREQVWQRAVREPGKAGTHLGDRRSQLQRGGTARSSLVASAGPAAASIERETSTTKSASTSERTFRRRRD